MFFLALSEIFSWRRHTLTGMWRRRSWRPVQSCMKRRPKPRCWSPTRMETCTPPLSMAAWHHSLHSKSFWTQSFAAAIYSGCQCVLWRILIQTPSSVYFRTGCWHSGVSCDWIFELNCFVLQKHTVTDCRTEGWCLLLRFRIRSYALLRQSHTRPHTW